MVPAKVRLPIGRNKTLRRIKTRQSVYQQEKRSIFHEMRSRRTKQRRRRLEKTACGQLSRMLLLISAQRNPVECVRINNCGTYPPGERYELSGHSKHGSGKGHHPNTSSSKFPIGVWNDGRKGTGERHGDRGSSSEILETWHELWSDRKEPTCPRDPASVTGYPIYRSSMPQTPKHNPRFKTALCKNWKERGHCSYYSRCEFAHGMDELRGPRHVLWRTKICRNMVDNGWCAFGSECIFIHPTNQTVCGIPDGAMKSDFFAGNENADANDSGYDSSTGSRSSSVDSGFESPKVERKAKCDLYSEQDWGFILQGTSGWDSLLSSRPSSVNSHENEEWGLIRELESSSFSSLSVVSPFGTSRMMSPVTTGAPWEHLELEDFVADIVN